VALEAVFLSAGVPDPRRGAEYARTADVVAIASAVSALLHVTLGRRQLVWGGHPAITPMVWAIAEDMGVDYAVWVRLYQSLLYEDDFPQENARFQNVTYTERVDSDPARSLALMRRQMLESHGFVAGIFIGGMQGIEEEFQLFARLHPKAVVCPVASTGGAALRIFEQQSSLPSDLRDDLDYVGLFHRQLGIPAAELRYRRLEDQPADVSQRVRSMGGLSRSPKIP
jgi:hypothetical protein